MRIKYNAPVTLTFVIFSSIALILGIFTEGFTTKLLFCVYKSSFSDIFFYPRIVLHVLGSGGYEHFINNTMFLLLLGPMLEEKYGHKNLIIMILITSLITGIFTVLFTNYAILGSSGIVFMFIILSSFTNIEKGEIPLTFIIVLFLFLGKEVFDMSKTDNISQASHIAGGLCGSLFGFYINRRRFL